jgi:hypothetical protein
MRLNVVDLAGVCCATVGIIFYVLSELYSVSVLQIVAAIHLVVALFFLFIAAGIAFPQWTAYKRFKNFEKLKEHLTKEYNERPDTRSEDEKSQDDADP